MNNSISASIIGLAGAILLATGAMVSQAQTSHGLMFTGAAVGLVGLVTWYRMAVQNQPR